MSDQYIKSSIVTPGQGLDPVASFGVQSTLENNPLVKPWSPSTKTGALFWFATDVNMTNNGSGGVQAWKDQVANFSITRVNSNLISFLSNSQNGRPGAGFATNSYSPFGGATVFFNSGSPFSIFIVCSVTAGAGTWYETPITLRGTASAQAFELLFSNDPNYASMYFGGFLTSAATAIGAAGSFLGSIQTIAINYNGGTLTSPSSWAAYQNNNLLSLSATTGTAAVPAGNVSTLIGSYANQTPPFAGFNGILYEFAAYNSVLSTQDLTNLETYCQGKWLTP